MEKRLLGSVVLVTGAAVGQGRAHAERCAAEGAHLVLGDIQTEALCEVVEQLSSRGHEVLGVDLDVSAPTSWAAAIAAADSRFGAVTGLINNAGIMSPGTAETEDLETWHRTIAVNQTGMMLGMQAVVPGMARSGGGSIVNVASTLGRYASVVGFAYQATKGAVRMMSKSAALSLSPHGIRVNTILPGLVETPFLGDALSTGALDDPISRTPLGRIARPEELASVAAFLLSKDASYMSGAELVVDGGMTAGSLRSLQPTHTPEEN